MERAAFTIYLVILILSVLFFGAVHTYVYTLMTLGVLVGALLLIIKNIKKDPKTNRYLFEIPKTGLNFLFLIMLGFLFFQIVPLPNAFVGLLSPEAETVFKESIPASMVIDQGGQIKGWATLAPYTYPVRMSIIRFGVYGLFFLGLIQVLNSRKRIALTAGLILTIGVFEALYGLLQAYSGSPQIWWFRGITDQLAATGTYINRNHFAFFMTMGILLAISFSGALVEIKSLSAPKQSLRKQISQYVTGDQGLNRRVLILFAGVLMGMGLIFSASRGGMISAAGGMLCLSLLFVVRKGHRRRGFMILALFLVTAVYALYIGVEYPISRFKTFDLSLGERSRYAQKTMDLFDDYRFFGTGVGNFQYAYPKYQAPEDKRLFIDFAHDDWAQFLAEAGIVGLSLMLGVILYYLFITVRLWQKRRDPFAVSLGAAPLAVMAAVAIHSVSDFNLHVPANFLILMAVFAIGYSALHLKRHHNYDRMLYRYHLLPLRYGGSVVLLLILALIVWTGLWSIRHFAAETYCNTVRNSTLNRDMDPPIEEIREATGWDRENGKYWYQLALKWMTPVNQGNFQEPILPTLPHLFSRDGQRAIIASLEKAILFNPFDPQYHLLLGWAYAHMWDEPDYQEKWLPSADIAMDRVAYFARQGDPVLHMELGNYWVMRSKTIYPNDPEHHAAWSKAALHYKKALDLEPQEAQEILQTGIRDYVWIFYPDEDMIRRLLD